MVGTRTAGVLGLTGYQWLVVLAAWLGWGFDVFDALLFNYVSRLCVPDLLNLTPGAPGTKESVDFWTGALTSLLLVGWGLGGILFGLITDRLGRMRTLLLTMLTYSIGTAACAFAPNIWALSLFRFIAALGVGGEWAAGAALVAETVPERRRVLAGALVYTASPAGMFLASLVNDVFTRQIDALAGNPHLAWRVVFLTGLAPAVVAGVIRLFIHEPPGWTARTERPRLAELFARPLAARTLGGLTIAVMMLLSWWMCASFLPLICGRLAELDGLSTAEQTRYITIGTNAYNLGGLVGTFLTIPVAVNLGRRPLFMLYFAASAVAIVLAYGADVAAHTRLWLFFFVGVTVFGAFGALPFYLPELFPMRLRGTGSGFCYNTGRFIAAIGPFVVPAITRWHGGELRQTIAWAAVFPALGLALLLAGLGHETRHETLRREPAVEPSSSEPTGS